MGNKPASTCDRQGADSESKRLADGVPTDLLLEQKRTLEQLNSWFELALNNMVRGLSMFDANQRLIVCNKSYRQIYSLPEELTQPGTPLREIVRYHLRHETGRNSSIDEAKFSEWLKEHLENLAQGRSFTQMQNLRSGRTLLVTYQPLADGGWVDIQEDVTEKRRAEEKIEWLAHHDALTGIANRFYFRETFENALKGVGKGCTLALHWLDIDEFKEVNDTYGHPIGDALLKAIAQRLRACIRRTDFLARLGGDEFAIIQAGASRRDQCERLARRVLNSISRPYNILGNVITISGSLGIVRAPVHGRTPDELLKNADIALYNVKSAGRRGFELFTRGSSRHVDAQRRLETDVSLALHRKQFELHYQPILSLRTHSVASCEALLRWRHPRNGLIAPDQFLPLAEKTGAIVDIGRWVLHQACSDAASWSSNLTVTVNLSLLQFESGDLTSIVQGALSETGLPASRLELEISESLLSRDRGKMRSTLDELRDIGVGITLDDFGKLTGSISSLRSFPFDKVKIDRTLVRDMPGNGDNVAIVKAVAALAEELGIGTVAEGVETIDELNTVARAGCNRAQGFYISRPVPAAELGAVLTECEQRRSCAA
ncbi:MAG: putative bifunctional diguanylate cyclase/phosphodiesterase [Hyphomicrobium sp.]|jgi:diguanylate cyclase (GGDEF)-like protein